MKRNAQSKTLLAIAGVISLLMVSGCTWLQERSAPQGESPGTASIKREIIITSGLESGMVLDRGETVITGYVTPANLDPEHPLAISVEDQISGLSYMYFSAEIAGEAGPGASEVNPETGEFVLDCVADLRIGEGHKVVQLIAYGAEGGQTLLAVPVRVTSQFPDFSWDRVVTARAEYGSRMLGMLDSYRSWVRGLPLDPAAFPFKERDLAILDVLIGYYTHWHQQPRRSGWDQAKHTLETQLQTLEQQWPEPEAAWEELWGGLESTFAAHKSLVHRELSLNLRLAHYPASAEHPGLWQMYEDAYLHTFAATATHVEESGERWEGILYADTGTPHLLLVDPEYQSQVIPGSGDPGAPAALLIVRAHDADSDGDVDSLEWEALVNFGPGIGPGISDPAPGLGPHPHQGPASALYEPLAALALSYWWE